MNFFDLTNKVAVITGGSSGIGQATAKRLQQAGAKIVIGDLRPDDALLSELNATFVATDVSKEEQVAALMQKAHEEHGRLDIVVNCAGVNRGYNTLTECEKDDFDFNYNINTMGVVFGIKHAAKYMNQGGSIINVSSAAGVQGVPYLAPYVSSKWAVIGITKTAALELGAKNIRVNAVCPTSVDTPMARAEGGEPQLRMEQKAVPLGRIAKPSELASMIHFLASDDCAFINGQAIGVDGGFSAGMSIDAYNTLAQ
ncbi:SDR family NAD(P)-dependent oxidoreductase [Paraferrimonas sp. SM1919]|uniref:SDR family NAD(P)-dependent oxidoreductase n=1 Tax=Paraferrimonas sp. SM1919 TaxID=2662263 RepID=UPI0013D420D2|nr:SDR family oxidoreductase [Paraferrimonas sp. SM1919]